MELLEIFEKKLVIDDLEADDLCLFNDKIEFDNIGLSHDNKRLIFSNINFEIPKGHTVALVGKTGGGKSSLLNLAARLFEPTSGTIRIDGHDIRDIKTSSLRKIVGIVPQNPGLFNTTIMENLKYANLNATDQQVHDACRAAGIHDTIMEFPDQYDTIVGHREIKLSGGESQRISIARIILLDPQIILLDEVTSNLDRTTERLIQSMLKDRSKNGRTLVIVTHNLTTVQEADIILVLDEGAIRERGKHHELLNKRGIYYDLWSNGCDGRSYAQ